MDDQTNRRPVDQFAGDGSLLRGGVRLGRVMYVINLVGGAHLPRPQRVTSTAAHLPVAQSLHRRGLL